jgi:hypothetical protein
MIDPAVRDWARRAVPGARVVSCTVRPLARGAVARYVEQLTLHLGGGPDRLELVRKEASAHEIAGLRAAQAVRLKAPAVPELVAAGPGWLITPLAPAYRWPPAILSRPACSTRSRSCMPATRARPACPPRSRA